MKQINYKINWLLNNYERYKQTNIIAHSIIVSKPTLNFRLSFQELRATTKQRFNRQTRALLFRYKTRKREQKEKEKRKKCGKSKKQENKERRTNSAARATDNWKRGELENEETRWRSNRMSECFVNRSRKKSRRTGVNNDFSRGWTTRRDKRVGVCERNRDGESETGFRRDVN